MPVTIGGSGPITGVTSINTSVSDTELGYLDGVTSALQTQLAGKADTSGNGAWTSWTPTISAVSGTITTSSITSAAYQQIGKVVICRFDVSISNAGTASGALRLTVPVSAKNITIYGGGGREYSVTGVSLTIGIDSSDLTRMEIRKYDNGSIIVNNYRLIGELIYEAA